MATTINAYSVGLHLDASSYIRNSSLSRKETASLTRSINAARTPADKYSREITKLEKALAAGAIDQDVFNKLLSTARDRYLKTIPPAKDLTNEIKKQGKASTFLQDKITGLGKAFVAFAAARLTLQAATGALRSFGNTMQEVDKIAKTARGIGVSFNELQAFQLAAGEFAGVEGPQAAEMLAKLGRRAGDAANGLGESVKAFELVGLTVDEIRDKSPIQLFQMVADKIAAIEDPTLRTSAAVKLFEAEGKKMIPMLMAGSDALDGYQQAIDRLGLSMDDGAIAKVEAFNDQWARFWQVFEGAKRGIIQQFVGDLDAATYRLERLIELASWSPPGLDGSGQGMGLAGRGRDPANVPTMTAPSGLSYNAPSRPDFSLQEPSPDLSFDPGQFTEPILGGLQGFAAGMLGGFSNVGSSIIANAKQNTQAQIAANTESPAIQSLEVGTQEAYKFMNDQQAELLNIEKAKEKKQAEANAKAEEIGNESNRLLGIISDWAQENGFQPIR